MAILLHPESIDARNGLVNCLLSTNRFAEALALLNELLEAKPNDLFCHKAQASALQGLNREEDAVIALETLRRMNKLDTAGTFRLETFITTLIYMTSPLRPTNRLSPKRNSASPAMPGRPRC